MDFQIKNQVIRNQEGKVKFWNPGEGQYDQFHLGVWIEGDSKDLDKINEVKYLLHPTFPKRERISKNRENKFSITFWTWGMFEIEVTISFKDGGIKIIKYYLSYDLPKDDGNNFVKVNSR